MNDNSPGSNDRLAAQITLENQRIPKAVADRITGLADGGLGLFEIQSITGIALPLIRLVLRGATPGAKP
jgi:hypothetical protein